MFVAERQDKASRPMKKQPQAPEESPPKKPPDDLTSSKKTESLLTNCHRFRAPVVRQLAVVRGPSICSRQQLE
jgi:hypothetical protein